MVPADAAVHLSDDTLQGVVDGFLDEAERDQADRHLAICNECRRVRDVLLSTQSAVGPGGTLGRFRLLHEVGSGSIGRVLAAWDPVLSRRVAVKVLRVEATQSERAQKLLLREAQALARLTHPNVVAIHDAGTEHGVAWLAMEFVEGTTLNEWLKLAERSSRDIVRRFREACAGLASAHRVGLLHRDFKLSNLMVGIDGRLRVTDFGLAALARDAVGGAAPAAIALETSLTDTGALVGTPAYLAPEQWQGQPASNATDQFSVAVAMFEALTGERPFSGTTVAARLDSIRRGPKWPLSKPVPRAVRVAVTRALKFQAGDRFASVEDFGRALEAFEKRRSALVSISAGLVVLASVGGVWFERTRTRCTDLNQRLAGTWDDKARAALASRGELQAALDAWSTRWVGALEATCDEESRVGAPQRARVTCLEEQRRLVAALVNDVSANSSVSTAQALEAVVGLPPPSVCAPATGAPPVEESVDQSAIRSALALHRLDDAERLVAQLELEAQTKQAPRALAVAALLGAELTSQRGRLSDAEQRFRRAIVAAERAHADDVAGEAWVRLTTTVGVLLRRHAEALSMAELAGAIVEARGRPTDRAELEVTRGELLRLTGRYDEALTQARLAQRVMGEAYGPTHWRVARAIESEGKVLELMHDSQGALALFERAERQAVASLPPFHPVVLSIRNNRVIALSNLRRHADAEQEARAALVVLREKVPESPLNASLTVNLGRALRAQGKLDDALAAYEQALAAKERTFGPDHIELAMVLNNLAGLHAVRKHPEATLALHERAYAIRVKSLPADHADIAMSLVNLGHALQEIGRCRDAVVRYGEALVLEEKRFGAQAPALAEELTGLGECWVELGQPTSAVAPLERAVRLRENATGEDADAGDLAQSRLALARALVALNRDLPRAESLAKSAAPSLDAEFQPALEALLRKARW